MLREATDTYVASEQGRRINTCFLVFLLSGFLYKFQPLAVEIWLFRNTQNLFFAHEFPKIKISRCKQIEIKEIDKNITQTYFSS